MTKNPPKGFERNPLIKKLLSLGLPADDYAIFGSGPLFAHGLIELNTDIDVIARGKAWEKACGLGKAEETRLKFGSVVGFFDKQVTVFDDWTPGEWDIDELIETADVIGGIRFVNLRNTLKWKRLRARPKDTPHIKLMEEYFAKQKAL